MAVKQKQKIKCKQGGLGNTKAIVILFFAFFGFLWMRIAIPFFIDSVWYNSLNPVWQYVVYNIGIIFLFSGTFGIPIGYFIKKEINITDIIRGGFSTFIGFSWFVDMQVAPYAWDKSGNLIVPLTPESMDSSSVDYMFGWVFEQIGIHGSLLYDMVYIFIPILGVIIIALTLKPKELLKLFCK